MRLYLIILVVIASSCNRNDKVQCSYSLNDLLDKYDSNQLLIKRYPESIEVFDSSSSGERGFYLFDKQYRLLHYAYLLDNSNNYYYEFKLNPQGNIALEPESNVVRWFVSRLSTDIVQLSFFFNSVPFKYGNIKLSARGSSTTVPLFEHKHLSNLIGADVKIKVSAGDLVYLTGNRLEKCSGRLISFRDSIIIPSAVRSVR